MSKIILSKTKFIKLIFIGNINYLGELLKLKNNIPLFSRLIIIKNYSILIINKNLMDLLEDASSSAGKMTFTIIGKRYNQKKKAKLSKNKIDGLSPVSKKILVRTSKQKGLINTVVTITPKISKKNKIIIISSKCADKKTFNTKPKGIKSNIQTIKSTEKKQNKKNIKQKASNVQVKKTKLYVPKKVNEKRKSSITYISKEKKNNDFKINISSQIPQKYSLQKTKSKHLVAIFSTLSASILFGLGLAGIISHNKIFKNVLAISSLALGHKLIKHNKPNNKKLVKKI